MNFSRKMDKFAHNICLSQARMFEKSVDDGLPSYFFIKSFMKSPQARAYDELNLDYANITEVEIYDSIKNRIKIKRGTILPYPIMRFIGYFYRAASYLLDVKSTFLFDNISPKYLSDNYLTLHSLSIEEAIKEVFASKDIHLKTKEEILRDIYKKMLRN